MLPALLIIRHNYREPVQQSIPDCRQLLALALHIATLGLGTACGHHLIRFVLVAIVHPVLVLILELYTVRGGGRGTVRCRCRLGRCLHGCVFQIFVVLVVELDVLRGELILALLWLHRNVIGHQLVLIPDAVVFPVLAHVLVHLTDHVDTAVCVVKDGTRWPEGRFVICFLLLLLLALHLVYDREKGNEEKEAEGFGYSLLNSSGSQRGDTLGKQKPHQKSQSAPSPTTGVTLTSTGTESFAGNLERRAMNTIVIIQAAERGVGAIVGGTHEHGLCHGASFAFPVTATRRGRQGMSECLLF